MIKHLSIAAFGVCLATASALQAADGADKSAKAAKTAAPAVEVISVTIHPAAEPKPALKYHLLPTFLESTPGDAMPCYLKALMTYTEQSQRLCNSHPSGEKSDLGNLVEWLATPLDKLPRDRVRKLVDSFGGLVKNQLEMAVRREHCNWDMPLRQGHVFEILLPEVQEFRNVARVVALRARLQIAEGTYSDAVASLKTGYGMARQVAEQPFLVSNLVGTVIAQMMNDQLLTLCQQPGAPNLYWSIAELPSPWTDRRRSIQAEYDGVYLQWPELQAIRHAQYVPEQWNLVLRQVVAELVRYGTFDRGRSPSDKEQAAESAKVMAQALNAVPRAKADLIAAGHTQKELDAMPAAQIVLLHAIETCDRLRDDLLKWWHLPYWQAQEGIEAASRSLESAKKQELIPMATVLLPTASSPLHAFARTDRQLAALRCIEALRLYAAAHNGELPATLDEIKEVPIPLNPMTGKPFPYHLEGKTAVLDADGGLTKIPRPQYRVVVAK
jgi:hypothetical protein